MASLRVMFGQCCSLWRITRAGIQFAIQFWSSGLLTECILIIEFYHRISMDSLRSLSAGAQTNAECLKMATI